MRQHYDRGDLGDRINKLCYRFGHYIGAFEADNPFTGPSRHFHLRAMRMLDELGLERVLGSGEYGEILYATLASWGLHRMGPKGSKLAEYDVFSRSLRDCAPAIRCLADYELLKLDTEEVDSVADALWELITRLRISATNTQLVAGSKALHHLLPRLAPPIDREYTLRFHQGHKNIGGSGALLFSDVFSDFWAIGQVVRDDIAKHVGPDFHTSVTKVIDNAIVGFVRTEMPRQKELLDD